jgi:hypothetical protein
MRSTAGQAGKGNANGFGAGKVTLRRLDSLILPSSGWFIPIKFHPFEIGRRFDWFPNFSRHQRYPRLQRPAA